MELHIQKCQNCGSRSHRNILVRDTTQKVYVQCRQCEELVARYILTSGGYFHSGKGFESFLRSIERDGGNFSSSGRNLQDSFLELGSQAKEEFSKVKIEVEKKYSDGVP